MKNKIVLVISYPEDGSAQLLIQKLKEIKQPYLLVDTGQFPNSANATIQYVSKKPMVFLKNNDFQFTNKSVKSIWWRRPKGKIRPPTTDPVKRYVEVETEIFVNSLFTFFQNVRWVSEPEKTRMANHKPLQLGMARQLGFQIPKTVISNDPKAVKRFLRSNWDIPLTMKPVGTCFVRVSENIEDPEGENLTIYTRIIDKKEILHNLEMISNCPVIFQEAIVDKIDIRVTVIGNSIFAVKIGHCEDLGAGNSNLDWRNQKLKRTFEKHQLPSKMETKCVELTKELGLNFGAIDLCYSKKRGYYFFEINPQGQWVPSETIAGHPISSAFASFLSNC